MIAHLISKALWYSILGSGIYAAGQVVTDKLEAVNAALAAVLPF